MLEQVWRLRGGRWRTFVPGDGHLDCQYCHACYCSQPWFCWRLCLALGGNVDQTPRLRRRMQPAVPPTCRISFLWVFGRNRSTQLCLRMERQRKDRNDSTYDNDRGEKIMCWPSLERSKLQQQVGHTICPFRMILHWSMYQLCWMREVGVHGARKCRKILMSGKISASTFERILPYACLSCCEIDTNVCWYYR